MLSKAKELAKKHWKKALLAALAAGLGVYLTHADGGLKAALEELLQKLM